MLKKKNIVLFIIILGIVIIIGLLLSQVLILHDDNISKNDDIGSMAVRPHLMVNNQIYSSSSYPPDLNFFNEKNFVCIGKVEAVTYNTPTKNFEACNIEKGAKIYYDEQFPHIIYVDGAYSPYRYATAAASQEYIYYDNTVYVSLSSLCGWNYDSYVRDYIPIYGNNIAVIGVPEDAIYIGETKFVGYNMFVSNELETNEYNHPISVYQDCKNSNILYAGDDKTGEYSKIYVAKTD